MLVAGFQGVSGHGDVTTLGRGGSDATAIAIASALGARECDIFTDVPGVFTADPRVVTHARKLTAVSHEEMLQLADAGARVLQTRAVELAAAHDIDIHVRSSFTSEPGTWIRRQTSSLEDERISGIAHIGHDPLYTVSCPSPAMVSAAMAQRGLAIGLIIHDDAATCGSPPRRRLRPGDRRDGRDGPGCVRSRRPRQRQRRQLPWWSTGPMSPRPSCPPWKPAASTRT